MSSVRLPAHLYDLAVALDGRSAAGENVSPAEIKTRIAPHAEKLRSDHAYRQQVEALLAPNSGGSRATARAVKPLIALLNANPVTKAVKVGVQGTPRYSPGVGRQPPEALRQPGMIYGPHVAFAAIVPGRGVKPLTELRHEAEAGHIRVNGRNVEVIGTLTVYLKGEEFPGLPNMNRRIEVPVQVPAPLIAAHGGDGLGARYGLVIRDGRPGHEHRVLKATTFAVGGLPM